MNYNPAYVNTRPDLTKKVRYGRGDRQMETEERGEREEPIDNIYLIPDNQEPIYVTPIDQDPVYATPDDQDSTYVTPIDQDPVYVTPDGLDRGTLKDAVQNNSAQEPIAGSQDSKLNRYIAAAVCVGLGLLLLAGIIILVVLYCVLIKEKHDLQTSFDQLQTRPDNLTGLNDQWKTRFDKLLTRLNNMTEQRDQYKTMFERDDIKKFLLCESHGFTFGDGVCYYISTETKTWEESRTYCRDKQSDLMIIKSKEKEDFVGSLNQWVWLGLTDSETEGVWKWVDGTPLTTPTYWQPSEPNNAGEEDCVVFSLDPSGGWDDRICSLNYRWICEIVL